MSAVAIAAAMTPSANQIGSCGSRLSMLQPRYAPSKYRADSSGRRNMMFVGRPKQLIKCLGRCFPCKRLSGTGVEGGCHGCNRLGAVHAEVGAFGKVLAQQPIGVLVAAALPWAVRIAEVDLYAGVKLEACMLGHFSALIPSQRPTQFLRQGDDRARNGVAHRLGTMSGEWGSVLHANLMAMAGHTGQMQQQGEAGCALHQGAHCGTPKTEDEIPFPMTWYGTIGDFCRTLADHDLGRDEGLAAAARARPRRAQHPAAAQAGRQLAAQCASPLHEQRLVDRLMADAHGLIVWEVDRQAAGELLRTPGVCPSPVLPRPVSAAFPGHRRAGNSRAARGHDGACQSLLHIGSQCRVARKLCLLGAASGPLGVPLRCCRAIL